MLGMFDTPTLGPRQVELWPFQNRAVEAVFAEFKKGVRRTLLNLCTGAGKTIVAAEIMRVGIEHDRRVLFLAHTDELIQQTAAKLDLLGVQPAIEQGEQHARMLWRKPNAVVASVMTMMRSDRLTSWPEDYFHLVIVDEGHRVLAPSYKRILAHFQKAKVIVLTATPLRADEQEIGHVVESVAMRFSVLDAWEEERKTGQQYLCDIRMTPCDLGLDLRKLKASKEDFNEEDTRARIVPMMEIICNKVREHIGTGKTVAFCPSILSARMFAAGMSNWFPSDAVWGNDPDRATKIKRYREQDLQVLANMNMLVEGWDVPETSNVALLRRTQSWSMILQQIGRGMRGGKEFCKVIDLCDVTGQFGETPGELFLQPLGILGGDGFDQEVNRILAEMIRENPEVSLKTAIEEAKDEHERRKKRQQFAVRMSIAERQIDCYEEQYSVKEAVADGEVVTGKAPKVASKFRPATEPMIRFLKSRGVQNCDGWSFARAGAEIGYLKRQEQGGVAPLWKRRHSVKKGVAVDEAREMSVAQANDAIERYSKRREEVYK